MSNEKTAGGPGKFSLEITMSGLCLFVPQSPDLLYVLMPDTHHIDDVTGCPGIMQHYARARFDGQYAGSSHEITEPLSGDIDWRSFGGGSNSPKITIPTEIRSVVELRADGTPMDYVQPEYFLPDVFTSPPSHPHLATRLVLPGSTTLEVLQTIDTDRDNVATIVRATIRDIDPSHAPLPLGNYSLTPNNNNVIKVFIGNMPQGAWAEPPTPMTGTPITPDYNGFYAFYDEKAHRRVPTPKKGAKPVPPVVPTTAKERPLSLGEYTCMTGSGCGSGTC
jgi:hypothetical protein